MLSHFVNDSGIDEESARRWLISDDTVPAASDGIADATRRHIVASQLSGSGDAGGGQSAPYHIVPMAEVPETALVSIVTNN